MSDSPEALAPQPSEKFSPPAITDLASLTDGRKPGEYSSIYSRSAWVQIGIEFAYLVCSQLACFYCLVLLALYVLHGQKGELIFDLIGPYKANQHLVAYASIGFSGVCGGCTFALKWLYHTVAKMQWHRDRLVWRLVVPISSAFLALFSGLMIISGLVPFLARAPLMVPVTGAAYGFFVGLFSDNVLAALQKLAFNVFGTIDKGKSGPSGFAGPN
jgi:hypothetical protein